MPYWCHIAGQRLLTIFGRQPDHSTRTGAHWLHPREESQLAQFSSAARRSRWLRGRLAIKQLIQHVHPQLGVPHDVEIISRDQARNLGCAPRVYSAGDELKWRPSLTHTERYYAACIAEGSRHSPGIDLVEHDELDPSRMQFWLRDDEREQLDRIARGTNATRKVLARFWGGKEAAFKTLPVGTPFQPQRITIQAWDEEQESAAWHTLDQAFSGTIRWDELPNLTLALAVRNE